MQIYKNFLIIFSILISLNGCKNENKIKDENITKSNIKNDIKISKNLKKEENQNILNKIGITATNDKIVIDTNKTKTFFENLAKTLEKKAKEIKENAKKISDESLGIEKNSSKITIDLNKTQKTLDKFSKELESFAKELGKIFEDNKK